MVQKVRRGPSWRQEGPLRTFPGPRRAQLTDFVVLRPLSVGKEIAILQEVDLDLRVLAAAVMLCAVTALAAAVLPALQNLETASSQ